jgi:hypothetical protein
MVIFITGGFVTALFGVFFETKVITDAAFQPSNAHASLFLSLQVIFMSPAINYQLLLISSSYVLWGVLMSAVIYVVLRVCRFGFCAFNWKTFRQAFSRSLPLFASGSNTRDESCESALIIHKILQNKPAFMLNDETFYGKMKAFTLQILHRKKVCARRKSLNLKLKSLNSLHDPRSFISMDWDCSNWITRSYFR